MLYQSLSFRTCSSLHASINVASMTHDFIVLFSNLQYNSLRERKFMFAELHKKAEWQDDGSLLKNKHVTNPSHIFNSDLISITNETLSIQADGDDEAVTLPVMAVRSVKCE